MLQKIIPLRFLSLIKESSALIILLILRFFLSVIFIIIQIKFIYIIGASSIYSITLVVISLIYREYTIWRFYSYFIFQIPTLGVTYNMSLLPFKSSLVNQLPDLNTVLIISVFIAGFPPSPLFFIKLRVIYQFIIIHKLIRIMLILGARLVMYNYINIRMILFIISPRKLIN